MERPNPNRKKIHRRARRERRVEGLEEATKGFPLYFIGMSVRGFPLSTSIALPSAVSACSAVRFFFRVGANAKARDKISRERGNSPVLNRVIHPAVVAVVM